MELKMEQINVWLPGEFNGVQCQKPWTLNLEVNGKVIDVHFSKADGSNGKQFLRIAAKDKAKFIKACK